MNEYKCAVDDKTSQNLPHCTYNASTSATVQKNNT